jgi:dipeptidase E
MNMAVRIMGTLFLYSDQVIEGNRVIDQQLFLSFESGSPFIAYIPSNGDPDRLHYHHQLNYYQQYGLEKLLLMDITEELDERLLNEAGQCDAIHLSGGNPILFRESLLRSRVGSFLVDYYNRGGTLVGVSGGAVQFGISTALFKLFQHGLSHALENDMELGTLNLAAFDFLPHYNRWSDSFKKSVEVYTKLTNRLVYAADDGSGIVVKGEELAFIGNIKKIQKGRTVQV